MAKKSDKKKKGNAKAEDSHFLKGFLQGHGIIFFALDSRYRYQSFSADHAATMKKIWGVSIAVGMNMLELILSTKDRAKAKRNFDRALRGSTFTKIEEYGDPGLYRTYYEDKYGPIKNARGKIQGLYVVVTDITGIKKEEEAVNHFNSLLTSSLDSVESGIVVVDFKDKVIFKNQKFMELLDVPQELATGTDYAKLFQYVKSKMEDPNGFQQRVNEILANPLLETNDLLLLKDGRVFNRTTKPHFLEKKIIGRVLSLRDISTQLTQERALLEWKQRHQLVVASFGRIVYDYNIASGKIVWSGNIQAILGYRPEEMGDINTWGELIHPEDRSKAFQQLEEAQKNLTKYNVSYRFLTKSEIYIWVSDNGFFMPDANGGAEAMLGEMNDISGQVKAEREIKHLASFPMHSPEVVFELTKDGSLFYGNPAFHETIKNLGLKDHLPFVTKGIQQAMVNGGQKNISTEMVIEGRTYNERIFYLPEEELIRIYAFDLTDRVALEKQKNNLELTYKAIFENATDAILIVDIETGLVVSANEAAAIMHGYKLSEFLTLSLKSINVDTSPTSTFEQQWNKLVKKGKQAFEVTHYRKDGSIFPLDVVASPIEISGKKFLLAIERDISARKKAEAEIHAQLNFIDSLVKSLPNIVYVFDLQTRQTIYVNQKLIEAFDFDPEKNKELTWDHVLKSLHPDDVQNLPEWDKKWETIKDGEVLETQFRVVKKNGSVGTFRSTETVFMRDDLGRVKQFMGTGIEITERIRFEKALIESEERFRLLHEASFGGIGIHDQGIILECNQALCEMTGYTYKELIGFNGLNLLVEADRPKVREKIANQDETPYDAIGIRKDGSTYNVQIHGKTLPFKGKSTRVTEFRDITERKKSEGKILEQNVRLQAVAEDLKFKNEQLDEFTQIVSHNLRAPAGNIIALTDFLEGSPQEAERIEIARMLKKSGNSILGTLTELNDVLKIKQNINIEKQQLLFEEVFQRVYNMLNWEIASTKADVQQDFSQANNILYPNIYLESILLNLMSNAIKYKHPDRNPQIKIRTYVSNDRVVMQVADNGLGLNLVRYGHQVFKMRKTFHNHPDSRGIGLFMVKNQIEAMKGQISIESKENVGSTFTVIF